MEALILIGKVNFYWILLFCFYHLLLRKQTFFRLNRAFLIAALIAPLGLSMIEFTETITLRAADIQVASASSGEQFETQGEAPVGARILYMVYWLIAAGMLFYLIQGFYKLFRLIREGEIFRFADFKLVLLPATGDGNVQVSSFSFFQWMVISRQDYEACFELVMQHESIHIRQRHSYDIVLVEVLKVFCWFNPVLWLYKAALREVHEFLADYQMDNKNEYAAFLVTYARNASKVNLVNLFFNSSLLKSRIGMLFQQPTSRWCYGKYLLILPLLSLSIMLTAAHKRVYIMKTKSQIRSHSPRSSFKSLPAADSQLIRGKAVAEDKSRHKKELAPDTLPERNLQSQKKGARFSNYTDYNQASINPVETEKQSDSVVKAVNFRIGNFVKPVNSPEITPLSFPLPKNKKYLSGSITSDSTKSTKATFTNFSYTVGNSAWPYPPVKLPNSELLNHCIDVYHRGCVLITLKRPGGVEMS